MIVKITSHSVCLFVRLMVFNATFSNASVMSWRSLLVVEETGGPGGPGENIMNWFVCLFVCLKSTDLSQATDKLYHIMLYAPP